MPIQRQVLTELQFSHTHTIVMDGEMPDFQVVLDAPSTASVYMWVSPTDYVEEFDVLYVGKAGFGVQRRLRQHRGGFINSGAGRQNRALIAEWIAMGRSILVFSRPSAMQVIFGTEVSLYSTEEHALCHRFLPRWNRAAFPRATGVQAIGNVQVPAVVVEPQPATVPAFNEVADGDEIAAFYGELSAEKQTQFAQLITLIGQRDPAAGQKVVGGYSGQPAGYNGKPMLVFGRIGLGGRAMSSSGRIPLVDGEDSPLTVTFPESARAQDLDEALIAVGSSGTWRPLDLTHFLQNPNAYLI